MSVMYLLILLSLILATAFVIAFVWAIRSGQYDDKYTPSVRILFDDHLTEDVGGLPSGKQDKLDLRNKQDRKAASAESVAIGGSAERARKREVESEQRLPQAKQERPDVSEGSGIDDRRPSVPGPASVDNQRTNKTREAARSVAFRKPVPQNKQGRTPDGVLRA